MTAVAIIGSAWGDEGKGLMTDYFSNSNSIVCRYNGGSQAGHTVVTPDGKQHVFHHIGSGGFRGATTLLSRYFISNPILFNDEIGFDTSQRIIADGRGLVTTPYDMMINQIIEESRGDNRHGSCGVGINETLKRSVVFPLTIDDIWKATRIERILETIKQEWIPSRLQKLNLSPSKAWIKRLDNAHIIDNFVELAMAFHETIYVENDEAIIDTVEDVIFEGAQGLLLDQNHEFFPHVTPSNTGLRNPAYLASKAGIEELEVVYVTRAYTTRHGAGPFPWEDTSLRYADETNIPNMWQGNLRFGYLDLDLLGKTIEADLRMGGELRIRPSIAITCMDQIGTKVKVAVEGSLIEIDADQLPELVERNTGIEVKYLSYGRTRDDVKIS